MCREEVRKLAEHLPEIEALGVRPVCLVAEGLPAEIAAFAPEYWSRDLFLDVDRAFFAAVGEGKVRRGSLWEFANPLGQTMRNLRRNQAVAGELNVSGNLEGEDRLLKGGLMVLDKDGGVVFTFRERAFGDHASIEDVLRACRTAAPRGCTRF